MLTVNPGGHASAMAPDGTTITLTGSGTFVAPAGGNGGSGAVNIGVATQRANGTAVVRVQYSDRATGVLTIGCHGPGAPPGIFEGIATTKGYKTYYEAEEPGADPDANRTIFHVL